jgi:basic membrane lipoprotein Med (substrate-binding protein (PBP1-ABC) superfamily)
VSKLGRPWIRWSAAVGTVGTLAVATWLILLQDDDEVRERRYRAETACLLTGEQGIAGPAAKPIWEGMQRASLETKTQVTYLAAAGPQTAQNASTYLAGLIQQRCELLIAADEGPVTAVTQAARNHPQQRFAIATESNESNITTIKGTEEDTYILIAETFKAPGL